jgi:small subunit ribosomal protein S2
MENGSYTPDLVVFLNPRENAHGVKECILRQIPTVGIIDTDTDPRLVTYPIPANVEVRYGSRVVGTS